MSKCGAQQPAAPRRRLRVADLNAHLMCILCGGYYVDATTIIECLHSFCKSCLVRYLESNKYCPICEVQVHKTRPLQNIRPDQTLQDMVYKLVPGLFQKEMKCRREFYKQHPEAPSSSSPEDRGIIDPIECQFYSPDELVSLALELQSQQPSSNSNGTNKRYLRCPAAVTIAHLQKLVRNKFGLGTDYQVDLMFSDKPLQPELSIMEVAYVFGRKRKGQFHFTYRILDPHCKKMRLEEASSFEDSFPEPMDVDKPSPTLSPEVTLSQAPIESKSKLDSIISRLGSVKQNENAIKKEKVSKEWKEVQLQISENGVMSVTDITLLDKLMNTEDEIKSSIDNTSIVEDKKKPTEDTVKIVSKVNIPEDKAKLFEDVAKLPEKKSDASEKRKFVEEKAVAEKGKLKEEKEKVVRSKVKIQDCVEEKAGDRSKLQENKVKINKDKAKGIQTNSSDIRPAMDSRKGFDKSTTKRSNDLKLVVNTNSPITNMTKSEEPGQINLKPDPKHSVPSVIKPDPIKDASSKVVNRTESPTAHSTASTKTSLGYTPNSSTHRKADPPSISMTAVVSKSAVTTTPAHNLGLPSYVQASSASNKLTISTVQTSLVHSSVTMSAPTSPRVVCTTTPSHTSGSTNLVSASPSHRIPTSVNHSTITTSAVPSKPVSAAQILAPSRIAPSPTLKTIPGTPSTKKSSSSPVGYKTLKCGPKNWNPSISRNSFLSAKMEQQQKQQQQLLPQQAGSASGSPGPAASSGKPKFFKNTPRYLGNPASGVKPMYQVPDNKPEPPPPSKTPSVMKLDPRTLTPIVSNASSPTSKSPSNQSKGRLPFPSTTLSAQVNNHMPSSRSVTTTTTTSTASKMSDLSPAQAMSINSFLSNPFVPKGMPNFLYSGMPGLLPGMLRPGMGYPPVTVSGFHSPLTQPVGMLFNHHQIHRQLNPAPPSSPTAYPSSPSSTSSSSSSSLSPSSKGTTPSVQRIPSSGQKSTNLPSPQASQKNNRTHSLTSLASSSEVSKINGALSPKPKMPQTSVQSTQQMHPPHNKNPSSTPPKDAPKNSSPKNNDNNNTLSATKTSPQSEKTEAQKLPHNISKLFPKESASCGKEKSSVETKGAGPAVQPQQT